MYLDVFKLVGSIFVKSDDANKEIDKTTKNAKNLATELGSALSSAGDKLTGVGKKLAPVSAVFATALTASVKGASDFTDGMAKMSTLFDTTQTSVSDLSKEFLDLSSKTGISATELAEAGYQALSAGQSVEQVAGFVETAGNLARAGFTSTTTAVDVLTTVMNAYGESAGSAEEIANKLVRTQNLGKTTVDELASSMGKIIPTASSMNVDINNLTSGYVALTKQGIATAESTTYMNGMLNELGKSSTTVGKVLTEATGKSFQELMQDGNSLADVLQILKTEADESGVNFNELWGSAEAGKAALAILNGGVDEFNSTLETMQSQTDDVGEALDKLDTPSVKLHRSLNQVKNSGIELGTALLTALAPTIEKVASGIEKATTWFGSLDSKTQTMIATGMALVAGLAPVLIIGGKIISGVGSIISVLGALNPVVLIIIAVVGALVAIGVALYQNWDTIKAKCAELASNLKAKWDSIKSNISSVVNGITSTVSAKFNEIKSNIQSKIDGARDAVKNGLDKMKSFFNFSWELPKIKLPHFSISGSFSLNPPSIPHFSVSWYKKAMENPMMFTKPTLFGMNPSTGQLKGAGEAGDEVMIGRQAMLDMIQEAVANESSVYLKRIVELLQMFFPDVIEAVNSPVTWDNQVIAKKLAPAMSVAIGKIESNKGRGRG